MPALERFDFPLHTFSIQEPEDGFRVQFGKSWVFTAEPDGPAQVIYKLRFRGMKWFTNSDGKTLDLQTQPTLNVGCLQAFFRRHRLYKDFEYLNPADGLLVCKFNKPLEIPEGTEGGFGLVENISVELISVPQ